jgi:hypothetical protein
VPILSQRTINKRIRKAFDGLGNTVIEPKKLAIELRKLFKKSKIGFSIINEPDAVLNYIETTGFYCPDSPINTIIIQFNVNPNTTFVELTESLLVDISMTIQHELVHKRQFHKRGKKFFDSYDFNPNITSTEELKQYFETPDEVDAYALNIILGLTYTFPGLEAKDINKFLIFSDIWYIYDITSRKTRKRLLKKVYKLHQQGVHWDI